MENADAFVYYRNGELIAEATKGRIYDTDVEYAWSYLPSLKENLTLIGVAKGDAADTHKLLTTTSLRGVIGDELDNWQMSGAVAATINASIPLVKGSEIDINVAANLQAVDFISTDEQLEFTDIQGQVNFLSSQGLTAKKLTGQLFKQPFTTRIESKPDKTQIYLNSAITTPILSEWLALPIGQWLEGQVSYQARLDICPEKHCNQLVISSDLKGAAVRAFAPISKQADETRALTIVSDLGSNLSDQRSVVRFNYADQLRAVILGKDRTFERGQFTFGGQRPQVPEQPGIWVDGTLQQLDAEELQAFAAGFEGLQPAGKTEGTADANAVSFKNLNLSIDQLLFKQYAVNNLQVDVTPTSQGQQVGLQSDEVIGQIWVPNDARDTYRVDLERLILTLAEDEETEEIGESGSDNHSLSEDVAELQLEPTELPRLDLSVKHLVWRDKPMGEWRLQLRPEPEGARIENLHANMLGTELMGEVRWYQNGQATSDITLKLDSDDFNPVFEAWNLQEAIELKKLQSYVQLSWPGAPWDFEIAKADGKLQFDAGKGRLIDVGQSGNLLRVFGILNLQSLGRRLRLDFSDLFKLGVAFDDMKADYTITQGIAETAEPFMMLGPSANLVMQGQLDLANETVDKEIEVALPVTNNIPLVSVLLGAPQVAGAVFLIDRLIGDPLARFTKIKYNLSGDWGDPEIDLKTNKPAETPTADEAASGSK